MKNITIYQLHKLAQDTCHPRRLKRMMLVASPRGWLDVATQTMPKEMAVECLNRQRFEIQTTHNEWADEANVVHCRIDAGRDDDWLGVIAVADI